MIGPLKPQEITQEVILEGNIPKIIETSMPTPLILGNIIQEITQEVTPEGDPKISASFPWSQTRNQAPRNYGEKKKIAPFISGHSQHPPVHIHIIQCIKRL